MHSQKSRKVWVLIKLRYLQIIQGDGWSSNVSGRGKFLRILSPNLRCFVQAADGSIKRMTNSRQ